MDKRKNSRVQLPRLYILDEYDGRYESLRERVKGTTPRT